VPRSGAWLSIWCRMPRTHRRPTSAKSWWTVVSGGMNDVRVRANPEAGDLGANALVVPTPDDPRACGASPTTAPLPQVLARRQIPRHQLAISVSTPHTLNASHIPSTAAVSISRPSMAILLLRGAGAILW